MIRSKLGISKLLFSAVLLLSLFSKKVSSQNVSNVQSPLGTNLSKVIDYSGDVPFIDLFKASRPWVSSSETAWEDGRTLDLDANGWIKSLQSNPRQTANTVITYILERPGNMIVLYNGQGTFEYNGGAKKIESLSRLGRDVVSLDPNAGPFILHIMTVNPNDYLRDIRILLPGGSCSDNFRQWCDPQNPCASGAQCIRFEENHKTLIFNPDFLKNIAPYKLLRFMDWMRTNHSKIRDWSQRSLPTDCRWSNDNGVPLEIMIELTNKTNSNPWFTIPEEATDDYVRQFARVVRAKLTPNVKSYVEYTNEAWNFQFSAADYTLAKGVELKLDPNQYVAQKRFYSQRAINIFDIFIAELGGTQRVVRVLAGQSANPYIGQLIMDWQEAYKKADAYAIAPYFGYIYGTDAEAPKTVQMSVDQLLDAIETKDLPESEKQMTLNFAETSKRYLQLLAYEGGQHLAPSVAQQRNEQLLALFEKANLHPRMKTMYLKNLASWKKINGRYFVHFTNAGSWGRSGYWGAVKSLSQPIGEAFKYQALLDFVAGNPRWWPNDSVPDSTEPSAPKAFRVLP